MSDIRQELFNKAILGVMNNPAVISAVHNACAYDDGKGNCCAIGHIMKPESREKFKFTKISSVVREKEFIKDNQILVDNFSAKLLCELQSAHDHVLDSKALTIVEKLNRVDKNFRAVAVEYGLKYPDDEVVEIIRRRTAMENQTNVQ